MRRLPLTPRLLALALAAMALPAFALPTGVTVTPPDGSRFLVHQRFDLRVEGKGVPGATGYSATLAVDGKPVAFTSGAQHTASTDELSKAGWGGFNLRGYAFAQEGEHTVTATFSDSTGTVSVSAKVLVVDPFSKRGGGRSLTRNIVILLGDGMGVAHRTAARVVKYGATAGQPNGRLEMEQFPGTGLVSTHSLNSIITDSAPGMSGYVSGNHNFNGQEGVFPANVVNAFHAPRIEYLSEYLHRVKGTALGLVSTADLEDATPAANAVHTANRNAGTGVVDQYLDESDARDTRAFGTGLKVLLGGGRRWFLPSTNVGSSRSASTGYAALPADLLAGWGLPATPPGQGAASRDLIADFSAAGFTYAAQKAELDAALAAGTPHKLLGLFGYGNMNVALDKVNKRRGIKATRPDGSQSFIVDDYQAPDQPMLDEMAEAAFRVLSRDRDGFVLMIEGAHIDKQSHLMDADRAIVETLEFDRAVGVARRWADKLGDTTVLVLADHECSGFALVGGLLGGIDKLKTLKSDNASSTIDFTRQQPHQLAVGTYDAADFPRYAIQPDGYPATMDIDGKVLVGFGANGDRFENWLTRPLPVIDSLLPGNIKTSLAVSGYVGSPALRPEAATGLLLRGQVPGDQAVHTAADIPVSAYSTGNRAWLRFVGSQANTDIFFKLAHAALAGERPLEEDDHEDHGGEGWRGEGRSGQRADEARSEDRAGGER
jgi:alkaline phosphatase